jgi:ribosome-dependent ATPase
VTIFISTHFMNEAERCDRMSLMHAGRCWTAMRPAALVAKRGAATLEEAFIGYLVEASGDGARSRRRSARLPTRPRPRPQRRMAAPRVPAGLQPAAPVELRLARGAGTARDPVRATMALLGAGC